jgi:Xaa-Pro aminopeptidase
MDERKEYADRIGRIRDGMRKEKLDHLLLFDGGRHNFLRMNYTAYVSDFINVGPKTAVLLPLDGEPILFTTPEWDIPRAREESWISDVRPMRDLESSLSKLKGKAGLAGKDGMHADDYETITRGLGYAPADAKQIVENAARTKSDFELERLKKAAAIADAGVAALHEEARAGLKEFELAAIVEYRMRSLGAEDNFGMVVANSHNQALHPPTDRVVQQGDIIIGEITPCVGTLFVQICRTVVLGEPPPVVREKYAILERAMGLGLDAARTGAPASAVARAINGELSAAGYEKYCRPPYMRVRGHGLGCGSFAPGSLEDGNDTKLEKGMTFIIHPNQYLPETGYMTLGDTVVMTESKAEPLTKSSWQIFVKE